MLVAKLTAYLLIIKENKPGSCRSLKIIMQPLDKVSCISAIKWMNSFCIALDLHYLCSAVQWRGQNDYVDGKGFCCNDGSLEAAQARVMARTMKNNFQEGDAYKKMQFYYHPDHLGSSSYTTNLEGEVVQHILHHGNNLHPNRILIPPKEQDML